MSLFFRPEDAAKALEASQDKMFFGTKIHVLSHEGFGELPCQALHVGCGVKWGKVPESLKEIRLHCGLWRKISLCVCRIKHNLLNNKKIYEMYNFQILIQNFNGCGQDCCNSIALVVELPQHYAKPSNDNVCIIWEIAVKPIQQNIIKISWVSNSIKMIPELNLSFIHNPLHYHIYVYTITQFYIHIYIYGATWNDGIDLFLSAVMALRDTVVSAGQMC